MKKVRVQIKNETTLEILEDAHAGDIIDLQALQEIDLSYLQQQIEENKDRIYQQKIAEAKEVIETKASQKEKELIHQNEILKREQDAQIKQLQIIQKNELEALQRQSQQKIELLESKINALIQQQEKEVQIKIKEKEEQFQIENQKLMYELQTSQQQYQSDLTNKEKDYSLKLINQEMNYKLQIQNLNQQLSLVEQKNQNILKTTTLEKEKTFQEEMQKMKEQLQEKDRAIHELTFQKSIKNVKQTGEDLESWCDHEVLSYMQNGLFECTWEKDNTIVKEEEEYKGSKGDFIFKIYASEHHLENELLSSVLLDMKDENPDSVNKKKNEDYYKQLDKNRLKKKCKYAVLVSNLELDKPNILPIYKVNTYLDMYVVRPPYLMTFLNMLVSLNKTFKDLYLKDKEEKLKFKDSISLLEEFESLKKTYLEKPLELLAHEIDKISEASSAIQKSSKAIDDAVSRIIEKYIHDIENKLERFHIQKQLKHLEKITE